MWRRRETGCSPYVGNANGALGDEVAVMNVILPERVR
jgi:hypothetical protein